MKMVYISNSRMPTEKAHGIQIMKMCEAFANLGIDIELLVPRRRNVIKDSPFGYYGVHPCFKITKLPTIDLVGIVPRLGYWLQMISFLFVAKIYLGKKNFDLIYTRDFWSTIFFKNIALELHSLPRRFTSIHKKILTRAKIFIVLTSHIKEGLYFIKNYNKRILVSPDGVDLRKFSLSIAKDKARKKLKLPLDKKIVLYSGHLYDWKGAQVLADASAYLNQDTLIVFIGGTEKEIKTFEEKNGDYKNVRILGQRAYAEIPFFLKAADVLVLPNSGKKSISKFYTSPMKLFEYMASGNPIVASDLPSIKEVLNKNNAFLVKPDNPKALAEGISILLEDRELSFDISKKASEDVKNYSWDKRTDKILKFINSQ